MPSFNMEQAKLSTSSLQNRGNLSTSNNLLISSLSSGIFENKLNKPSSGVKRQNSENVQMSVNRKLSKTVDLKVDLRSSIDVQSNTLSKSLLGKGSISTSSLLSSLKLSSSTSKNQQNSTNNLSTSSIITSGSLTKSSLGALSSRTTQVSQDLQTFHAEESNIQKSSEKTTFPSYPNLTVNGENEDNSKKQQKFSTKSTDKNFSVQLEIKKVSRHDR